MKRSAVISLALALSLLAGCAAGAAENPILPAAPETVITPPVEAVSTPVPTQTVLSAEKSSGRRTLELLNAEYAQADGNVILSPLSVETALAMASEGAFGEDAEAMEALGLSGGQGSRLSRDDGDSVLSIANSMWFNEKLDGKVKREFKATLANEYGAEAGFFTPNSPGSVDEINGWVKEKTHEKIDSIVGRDALSDDALAILINAIYFGGEWTEPFEANDVRTDKFYADSKQGVNIQTAELMRGAVKTYFETGLATGFSKGYKNGYEFIAILPKAAGAQGLEEVLAGLDLDEFLQSRTWEYDVNVAIPKFELEYAHSLKSSLTALGLGSLFEPRALDGMLTPEALELGDTAYVGDVLHKTYMKMYETGTEAAAATAVVIKYGTTAFAAPREYRQVILDRPFAFLIRDMERGQIVFCGAVNSVE